MSRHLELVRAVSTSEPAHAGEASHEGVIRLARSADLRETAALIRDVIGGLDIFKPEARQSEIDRHSAEALTGMLARAHVPVVVARSEGQIIGFCSCQVDLGLLYVDWWGVRSDMRRRGVFTALFGAAEELARRHGCHKIWCDSHVDNHISAKALERAGFRNVARLDNHWYGHDYLVWEKAVVP